ncbi:MAG: UDP-N-acetylglucosamine 1-carboxyvinyltransferase, partial [Patescibacteria group bacterium]
KAESSEQPAGCTLGVRTIDAHYQAFQDLGVQVITENNHVTLDASNAKSGLIWLLETSPTVTENVIMFATSLSGTTTIFNAAAEPKVQDLCNFLNRCGAKIQGIGSSVFTIEGGQSLTPVNHHVISDHYEISTFLSLGALTAGGITIRNAIPEHFVSINREFAKFGINIRYEDDTAILDPNQHPVISRTNSTMIVRAQPWPALPVDMLPLFIPLALASPTGTALFHNWMYESGLFWTSEFVKMGADRTMCVPHRVIVAGGNKLVGATLEAPYIIRAVISMCMAALIADGETIIKNADSLHRGHPNFVKNLNSLGAHIEEI